MTTIGVLSTTEIGKNSTEQYYMPNRPTVTPDYNSDSFCSVDNSYSSNNNSNEQSSNNDNEHSDVNKGQYKNNKNITVMVNGSRNHSVVSSDYNNRIVAANNSHDNICKDNTKFVDEVAEDSSLEHDTCHNMALPDTNNNNNRADEKENNSSNSDFNEEENDVVVSNSVISSYQTSPLSFMSSFAHSNENSVRSNKKSTRVYADEALLPKNGAHALTSNNIIANNVDKEHELYNTSEHSASNNSSKSSYCSSSNNNKNSSEKVKVNNNNSKGVYNNNIAYQYESDNNVLLSSNVNDSNSSSSNNSSSSSNDYSESQEQEEQHKSMNANKVLKTTSRTLSSSSPAKSSEVQCETLHEVFLHNRPTTITKPHTTEPPIARQPLYPEDVAIHDPHYLTKQEEQEEKQQKQHYLEEKNEHIYNYLEEEEYESERQIAAKRHNSLPCKDKNNVQPLSPEQLVLPRGITPTRVLEREHEQEEQKEEQEQSEKEMTSDERNKETFTIIHKEQEEESTSKEHYRGNKKEVLPNINNNTSNKITVNNNKKTKYENSIDNISSSHNNSTNTNVVLIEEALSSYASSSSMSKSCATSTNTSTESEHKLNIIKETPLSSKRQTKEVELPLQEQHNSREDNTKNTYTSQESSTITTTTIDNSSNDVASSNHKGTRNDTKYPTEEEPKQENVIVTNKLSVSKSQIHHKDTNEHNNNKTSDSNNNNMKTSPQTENENRNINERSSLTVMERRNDNNNLTKNATSVSMKKPVYHIRIEPIKKEVLIKASHKINKNDNNNNNNNNSNSGNNEITTATFTSHKANMINNTSDFDNNNNNYNKNNANQNNTKKENVNDKTTHAPENIEHNTNNDNQSYTKLLDNHNNKREEIVNVLPDEKSISTNKTTATTITAAAKAKTKDELNHSCNTHNSNSVHPLVCAKTNKQLPSVNNSDSNKKSVGIAKVLTESNTEKEVTNNTDTIATEKREHKLGGKCNNDVHTNRANKEEQTKETFAPLQPQNSIRAKRVNRLYEMLNTTVTDHGQSNDKQLHSVKRAQTHQQQHKMESTKLNQSNNNKRNNNNINSKINYKKRKGRGKYVQGSVLHATRWQTKSNSVEQEHLPSVVKKLSRQSVSIILEPLEKDTVDNKSYYFSVKLLPESHEQKLTVSSVHKNKDDKANRKRNIVDITQDALPNINSSNSNNIHHKETTTDNKSNSETNTHQQRVLEHEHEEEQIALFHASNNGDADGRRKHFLSKKMCNVAPLSRKQLRPYSITNAKSKVLPPIQTVKPHINRKGKQKTKRHKSRQSQSYQVRSKPLGLLDIPVVEITKFGPDPYAHVLRYNGF